MKFHTTEQIAKQFIKDGWNKNTSFEELSVKGANEYGCPFLANEIMKGKKYFKKNISGNIYNDRGKIVIYNIRVKTV